MKERLADKIKFALMRDVRSGTSDIIIPNFYLGWYEMDLCKIMKSGYVVEYEIKISRSDFFADFKKDNGYKHSRLQTNTSFCNRFFFVTPKGLLKPDEIPTYAGLIEYSEGTTNSYWSNGGSTNIIKAAPLIHKTKQEEKIYHWLALKLSFRSQLIEQKYRKLVYKQKELSNE
jgi:hypothetical protein